LDALPWCYTRTSNRDTPAAGARTARQQQADTCVEAVNTY